jgi:hypothetical protein
MDQIEVMVTKHPQLLKTYTASELLKIGDQIVKNKLGVSIKANPAATATATN